MTNTKAKGSLFTALVFLALLLTFAAIILSAYLRLESIGLGCDAWPNCFGYIAALEPTGLVATSPAGVVHRVAASLLGLVVLFITIMALRGRRPAGVGLVAPLLVFALTVFLSLLGYSTPSPDLPAVTLGNLGGGMAMLALLWWISQRAAEPVGDTPAGLRVLAALGLLLLIAQITLGALTSAKLAGPACTALLDCGNEWQSLDTLRQGLDPSVRLTLDDNGRVMTGAMQQSLHMAHRLGAVLTVIFLAALAFRAVTVDARFQGTGNSIIMLLVVQVGLGVAAIFNALPLLLVTAHNAVAALLLLAVVNLNHLATPTRR